MIERFEELKAYLPGLQKEMPEGYGKLAEIFQFHVFELHQGEVRGRKTDYYIPYMMNDALECYLVLQDAWMTGEYLDLDPRTYPMQGQLAWRDDKSALIVKQGKENVFTIWFSHLSEVFQCYQYHRIGHFWVKGQEQWRRLVYMVGTVYEKYQYLGDEACSPREQEFMRLIEFPPFRYWSPVQESLDDRYPTSREGALCMQELAREAGDRSYARLAGLYGRFPFGFLKKRLAKKLCDPARQKLYELLYEKIRQASLEYPKRYYGEEAGRAILRERKRVNHLLHQAGFEGKYPVYRRGTVEVMAAEEHPFTTMESEDFVFRIRFMVSCCRKEKEMGRNCGFFRGKGRRGWIVENLKQLAEELRSL